MTLLSHFEDGQKSFSLLSMTAMINDLPYKPGRIGDLGVFNARGIATTKVAIESREGVLYLVPSTPRGAPSTPHPVGGRSLRTLNTLHLPVRATIYAASLQDVRAFATNTLGSLQSVVNDKLAEIRRSIEVTLEWQRLGALKGRVLDADGSEILNLFEAFNVSQMQEIDFDLDQATPAPGAVRQKCNQVIRQIEDELGGSPIEGVHALTGSAFFDAIVDHPETREAYARWNEGAALRERTARRQFHYAGITFEEYRGRVGTRQFVEDDKAHFFPTGTDGVFQTVFSPGNFIDQVNGIGLPYYARQVPDKAGRYIEIYAESNPLSYCTRPRVLIQGRRT